MFAADDFPESLSEDVALVEVDSFVLVVVAVVAGFLEVNHSMQAQKDLR